MLRIITYKIIPCIPYGAPDPVLQKNGSEWLRMAINDIYNRNKGRLLKAGVNTDLFHNHDEKTSIPIPRYPLIIYHAIGTEFFLTGINEGKETLEELIKPIDHLIEIQKNTLIRFEVFKQETIEIKTSRTKQNYTLTNWLALNQEAHKLYSSKETIIEKTKFLEEKLLAHITNDFGKFLNLDLSKTKVRILEIDSFNRSCLQLTVNRHQRDYQPFTLVFEANVNLPDFITLGIGKAFGFGRVNRIK